MVSQTEPFLGRKARQPSRFKLNQQEQSMRESGECHGFGNRGNCVPDLRSFGLRQETDQPGYRRLPK